MRGGRIAAEWLKAQGVTHVFALVGEHILPLVDGLDEAGIRVIGTRHEQAAVLAAEAFAKVSGRPGVAAVTAGAGGPDAGGRPPGGEPPGPPGPPARGGATPPRAPPRPL